MKNVYVIEYGTKYRSWTIVELTTEGQQQWQRNKVMYNGLPIKNYKKIIGHSNNLMVARAFVRELYRYKDLGDIRTLGSGISPLTATEHVLLMRDYKPKDEPTYTADIDYSTDDTYLSKTIKGIMAKRKVKPTQDDIDNAPF